MGKQLSAVLISLTLLMAAGARADAKSEFQQYLGRVAAQVKAAPSPAEKRQILQKSLDGLSQAITAASTNPVVTERDRKGLSVMASAVKEKQAELAGKEGFQRVADKDLDAFSDYVVQDMEQADQYVTISITVLLLIAILVILLVR